MDFRFTEEQEELRATARAFLAEHSKPEQVRVAMESEAGHDRALWKRIGAELGWTAVAIPEACGGLGLSWVEVVALQEILDLDQPIVSQQLAVLRAKNIVSTDRVGTTVKYALNDPLVTRLLSVAREIFNNHLVDSQSMLRELQREARKS